MAISSAENAARVTAPARRNPRAVRLKQPRKVGRVLASGEKRKAAGKALTKPGSRARKSESEEKFAVVFEKATVPMSLARLPNGEIVDVNEEWVKLFGFTKKEAAGKTGFELGIARDIEERRRVFRKVQKGAFVRCDQRQLFNKRGEALIVDCNVKSVTLGAQRYALSTMRDMTERKRAEADLAYHAYLLENVHDAVIGTDEHLVVTAWNKGAERMYGWRVDEALGRQLWELVPVDLTERERATGLRELKKAGRLRTEAITYRKDGTPVHVEGITIALGWEKQPRRITGYVNIRRDISERKRAEEALRVSEERFRRYFDLGLIGMAITSPSKGILEVNDELCRSLGYGREELLQKNWLDLTHPDDVAADVALFERTLAGEIDGYSLEKRWIRKDGRVIHSLVTAKCQRRPDRSVDYFVGLLLDITDRKRAEEALQQAQAKLEKVAHVSAMGEMAAAIAHEINQPLGAIVNNSAYCLQLLGHPEAEAKKRAALKDIANDANRASAIISRIRGLTNGAIPEITALNFRDLITEVVTLAQLRLTEHRIEVKTAVASNLPRMSGDRVHLEQVLLNLVLNAIEAMSRVDERARVLTIRAARTTLDKQPAIAITVSDTGAGFSEDSAEQMFDAFYSTKTGGMGMGLRVCRTIAEEHGGRLSARRNAGEGATFSLVLPIRSGGA